MRIGIDCRLSGKKHAGIGRYIEHLVTQLVENTNHSWVLFFFDQAQVTECFPNGTPKHVEIKLVPIRHYTIAEQIKLPRQFYQAKLDVLHVPHFNIPVFYFKKMIVTIHDLLWHSQRGAHVTTLNPAVYWFKYLFYRLITRISIYKASTIIVPSQTIKDTILSFYSTAKNKIVVTKEGVSLPVVDGTKINPKIKTLTKTHKPFLLYVGSLYPHKNVDLVLQALKQMIDYNLIITGSRSVFQKVVEKKVTKLGIEKNVVFTGYLSDEELTYVYSKATALVQPSFSEGFGLTGIEALSVGTPVLASNIPIFREIYKHHALYFDPHSVTSCIAAIKQLESVNKKDMELATTEVKREYNWHNTANQTLEIYQRTGS